MEAVFCYHFKTQSFKTQSCAGWKDVNLLLFARQPFDLQAILLSIVATLFACQAGRPKTSVLDLLVAF